MRIDNLCNTLAGNPCYILTVTSNIKSYLSSEDEQKLLTKSDAARAMMKKKLDIYEARQRIKEQLIPQRQNGNGSSFKVQPNSQDADDEIVNTSKSTNQANIFFSNETTLTPQMNQYLLDHKKKKAIVITSRVHPGESNASFIMQGILKFLLGNSREAKILRSQYIFKLIPMLNPDGVIYGNYRCSLLGVDLNRRWINPSPILHPTIFYTKQIVKMLDIERTVEMFTDVHGHSRKLNAFVYANCFSDVQSDPKFNALIKAFPLLLNSKISHFSYKDCRFAVDKEKESTARVVLFKELSIINSYTLEVSFFGSEPILTEEQPDINQEETDEKEEEGKDSMIIAENDLGDDIVNVDSPSKPSSPLKQRAIIQKQKQQSKIEFTPAILNEIGQEYCKTIVQFMNPLTLRKQVNHILNSNRKKKLQPQSFAVSKERLTCDPYVSQLESGSVLTNAIQVNQSTTNISNPYISAGNNNHIFKTNANQKELMVGRQSQIVTQNKILKKNLALDSDRLKMKQKPYIVNEQKIKKIEASQLSKQISSNMKSIKTFNRDTRQSSLANNEKYLRLSNNRHLPYISDKDKSQANEQGEQELIFSKQDTSRDHPLSLEQQDERCFIQKQIVDSSADRYQQDSQCTATLLGSYQDSPSARRLNLQERSTDFYSSFKQRISPNKQLQDQVIYKGQQIRTRIHELEMQMPQSVSLQQISSKHPKSTNQSYINQPKYSHISSNPRRNEQSVFSVSLIDQSGIASSQKKSSFMVYSFKEVPDVQVVGMSGQGGVDDYSLTRKHDSKYVRQSKQYAANYVTNLALQSLELPNLSVDNRRGMRNNNLKFPSIRVNQMQRQSQNPEDQNEEIVEELAREVSQIDLTELLRRRITDQSLDRHRKQGFKGKKY